MSTATAADPQVLAAGTQSDLKIYMHSPLLFWWPVWVVGFAMAIWTCADNYHLVLVPEKTVVADGQINVPEGGRIAAPMVHMARSKVPGAVFFLTLLWVLVSSHMWLRGPWALFATATVVAAVFLTSWLEWWEPLFRSFRLLDIHVNMGGYLAVSVTLFVVWALTFFVFDRRTYVVFSEGQIRIRDELGVQEKAFDTFNIAFEKKPYDWFRWLVGLGAGDMVIRVGGPHPQVFELLNVVRVKRWLGEMEQRLRTRDVT